MTERAASLHYTMKFPFALPAAIAGLLLALAGLACTKADFASEVDGAGASDTASPMHIGDSSGSESSADGGSSDAGSESDRTPSDGADADNADAMTRGEPDDASGLADGVDVAKDLGQDGAPAMDGAMQWLGTIPSIVGQIVITEVMNDPNVVAGTYGEWFEIYNPDDKVTLDLRGCQISDRSGHIHTIGQTLLVLPRQFRTLASHSKRTGASPFGVAFTPDYVYTDIRLHNTLADGVWLTCGGAYITAFNYAAPDVGMSGHSFSVDPAFYRDGENERHWCPAIDVYDWDPEMAAKDYGTPGQANPRCKP